LRSYLPRCCATRRRGRHDGRSRGRGHHGDRAVALVHDHDASVMILVWNLGTGALITGAGCLFGRRMF
jgi:hypothetical protein